MSSATDTKLHRISGTGPENPGSRHILVAEDDLVSRDILRILLESQGCRVSLVADGKAAVEAVNSDEFDMVFMDCMMPEMDGFEATRIIRARETEALNSGIPVIALTGLNSEEDLARCLAAGMNGHLGKPVNPGELKAMIENGPGSPTNENARTNDPQAAPRQEWDDQILEKLIDTFMREIPPTIAELNSLATKEGTDEIKALSHRIRGAADVIGFTTISSLARELENAGAQGDHPLALKLIPELVAELETLGNTLSEPTT